MATQLKDKKVQSIIDTFRKRLGVCEKYLIVDFINHPNTTNTDLRELEKVLLLAGPRVRAFFNAINLPIEWPIAELAQWYLGKLHSMMVAASFRYIYTLHESGVYQRNPESLEHDALYLHKRCKSEMSEPDFCAFVASTLSSSEKLSIFSSKMSKELFKSIKDGKRAQSGYIAFARWDLISRLHSDLMQSETCRTPRELAIFTTGYLFHLKVAFNGTVKRSKEELINGLTSIYSAFRTWNIEGMPYTISHLKESLDRFILGQPNMDMLAHWFMIVRLLRNELYHHKPKESFHAMVAHYEKLFNLRIAVDWDSIEKLALKDNKTVFYATCETSIRISKK